MEACCIPGTCWACSSFVDDDTFVADLWIAGEGILLIYCGFGIYTGWTILLVAALLFAARSDADREPDALFTVLLCLILMVIQVVEAMNHPKGFFVDYHLSSFFRQQELLQRRVDPVAAFHTRRRRQLKKADGVPRTRRRRIGRLAIAAFAIGRRLDRAAGDGVGFGTAAGGVAARLKLVRWSAGWLGY